MKKILAAIMMTLLLCGAVPAKDITVLPADIRGVVIRPDGKTPVAKLRIIVWDQKTEKTLYKTKTDKNGVFIIPKTERSNYFIKIRNVYISMGVFKARADVKPQAHGFVIVLPKNMPLTAPIFVAPFTLLPRIMSP